MNGVGVILTALFCLAVVIASRRWAALAFVGAVLYITQGQAIDIGGINFMAIRFVEVAAFLRVLIRSELPRNNLASVDKWLIVTLSAYVVVASLRKGTIGMYDVGLLVDGLLVYFTFRGLISDPDDLRDFLQGMALLLIPFTLLILIEAARGRNLFALMGGVPSDPIYRNGYFRAQASFRHAITAGTLGATFVPLFVGLLFHRSARTWALIGIGSCIAIVLACHSSGPLMAAATAIAAWGCWFVRDRMRIIRWGIVACLIALHLAMSAPVWFIFDRVSGIIGGDGWHRSNLIDQFLKHFNQWWLLGMPIEGTGTWAATQMPWGGVDVTNYYVSLGISGGLVGLVCFIITLIAVFKLTGRALGVIRGRSQLSNASEALVWGAGSAVCVHAVNITAVVYWDQSYVVWYLHLAVAVSVARYWLHVGTGAVADINAEEAEFGSGPSNMESPVASQHA